MNLVLDTLFLRRPKINYVSPPVCEAIFSGTGSPIIILADIGKLPGPTGLVAGGVGNRRLSWNRYPGALCYNVYTAVITANDPCAGIADPNLKAVCECQTIAAYGNHIPSGVTVTYELLAECFIDPFFLVPTVGCYRVSAITPDGESDLSDPTCICDFTPIPHPITVCNTSQTASCTPPLVGPDVTVPAGVYCIEVENDPDTVAAAQSEMNAQALAQAQSELACGSLPGGCIAWGGLTWDAPVITPGSPVVGSASGSAAGDHFDFTVSEDAAPSPPQSQNIVLQSHGELTFTNVAPCDCNLHLKEINGSGVNASVITISQNGATIFERDHSASGTFEGDYPFTIPPGVTAIIAVDLTFSTGGPVPSSVNWIGTLTAVG